MRLLLVEDDYDLIDILQTILKRNGYVVDSADTLSMAKTAISDNEYDIVVLDRMLPDGEGLDLIRYCNQNHLSNRFLVLSALNEVDQKVEGLDLGAIDYLPKPFNPEELLARIRTALRFPLQKEESQLKLGNLTYVKQTRDVLINEEPFKIPRREHLLLELFIKRFNRVVSKDALADSIYNYDDDFTSNALESHISRLRKKLTNFKTGLTIKTVRGLGYILKDED